MLLRILSASYLPGFIRRLLGRRAPVVLTYHCVIAEPLPFSDWCFLAQDKFRAQLEYLDKHAEVVSLSDAMKRGQGTSKPLVSITFDDGFQNNFDIALPVLREFDFPATIFLATDYIGTDKEVWFCRLIRLLLATRHSSLKWQGQVFSLKTASAKSDASAELQCRLKVFVPSQIDRELDLIGAALGVTQSDDSMLTLPFSMLNHASIKAMQSSDLIEFGAHTQGHAILSRLKSEQKRLQIVQSISAVESMTGEACRFFAYPNGGRKDFDLECIDILKATPIEAAFTMVAGCNDASVSSYAVHRSGVGADDSMARFKLQTHGLV